MAMHLSESTRDISWSDVLQRSIEPSGFEGTGPSAICASYMREEKLQYRFMMAFQTLVLALSIGALLLLLVAIWQAVNGQLVATLVSAGGTVVTGTAAKFLNDQRTDSRAAFAAAQAGVKENCG